MRALERLLAIEEIKLLRHRWCRFVDCGQWREIASLLAPDARLDLGGAARLSAASPRALAPIVGAGAICDWLEANVGPVADQLHVMVMPEIVIVSDDAAEGIWRQQSLIPAARARDGLAGLGFGQVRDTYCNIAGAWLIETMGVDVRLLV